MDRLDEIEARAKAATPGKWGCRIDIGNRFYVYTPSYGVRDFCSLSGGFDRKEDADFIAHTREDVPWLISEVRRLLLSNARLMTENAGLRESRQIECDLADANLETATRATQTIKTLGDENARLRAELEAAKRDIKAMLQAESYEEFCVFCKSIRDEKCMIGNCNNAEWRGVTENGGANGRAD